MSTWDEESEISKLNRNKSDSLIKVSVDLYSVIKESLKISKTIREEIFLAKYLNLVL